MLTDLDPSPLSMIIPMASINDHGDYQGRGGSHPGLPLLPAPDILAPEPTSRVLIDTNIADHNFSPHDLSHMSTDEVMSINWPDPSSWYYEIMFKHWKRWEDYEDLGDNDFRRLGLASEDRPSSSLYLTDNLMEVCLSLLLKVSPKRNYFFMDPDIFILAPWVSMHLHQENKMDQQKQVMGRWLSRFLPPSCKQLRTTVNFSGNHWITLDFNTEEEMVTVFDSLSSFSARNEKVIQFSKNLWEALTLLGFCSPNFTIVQGDSPYQRNAYDCGFYAILNAVNFAFTENHALCVTQVRLWLTWYLISIQQSIFRQEQEAPLICRLGQSLTDDQSRQQELPTEETGQIGNFQDNIHVNLHGVQELIDWRQDILPGRDSSTHDLPQSGDVQLEIAPPDLNQDDNISDVDESTEIPNINPTTNTEFATELEAEMHWEVISMNIGPVGFRKSWNLIKDLLKDHPAVVMLQDVQIPQDSIGMIKKQFHQAFPDYVMHTNSVLRRTLPPVLKLSKKQKAMCAQCRVATLIHKGWAHKAEVIDKLNLIKDNPELTMLENILVIRHEDPFTGSKGLWINVYNDTADHRQCQMNTYETLEHIMQKFEHKFNTTILAGDWNASILARKKLGFLTIQDKRADVIFRRWTEKCKLTPFHSKEFTFIRHAPKKVTVALDYVFWGTQSNDPPRATVLVKSAWDPVYDHRPVVVSIYTKEWSPLPTIYEMTRKVRICNKHWDSQGEEWKERMQEGMRAMNIQSTTMSEAGADEIFGRMDQTIQMMIDISKEIFGVTGQFHGKQIVKPRIRLMSAEERKCSKQLKLLRIALQNIHGLSPRRPKLTHAMTVLLDQKVVPTDGEPQGFRSNPSDAKFQKWLLKWKDVIRTNIVEFKQELFRLSREETARIAELARIRAIERMGTPGSKEIRRWTGKMNAPISAPYLKSDYPDRITLLEKDIPFCFRYLKLSQPLVKVIDRVEPNGNVVQFCNIPAEDMAKILQVLAGTKCTVDCQQPGKRVSSEVDKLVAWEFHLGKEAISTRTLCPLCKEGVFLPISDFSESSRNIKTWCCTCSQFQTVFSQRRLQTIVGASSVKKLPAQLPADKLLRRPISWEDFLTRIKELPRRKAPGPDEVTAEMLQNAPEEVLKVIFDAVNYALTQEIPFSDIFKNGYIFLLFKKGNEDELRNYRPVVLLSVVYKLLTSIVAYRLAALLEDYGIFDNSQEGFRVGRSTTRQIQAWMWYRDDAEKNKKKFIKADIDFCNAFNSIDHEAIWECLEAIGVPNIDLLQDIYSDTHYQADTPYGMSAKIFLSRGTKQGDCLSPLLFIIVFNQLTASLASLKQEQEVGYLAENGQRGLHFAFADDLSLITETIEKMKIALKAVEDFCTWSGAKVNADKSEFSGNDFRTGEALSQVKLSIHGKALGWVNPNNASRYLGVRSSITGKFQDEKAHVFLLLKQLSDLCRRHPYTSEQACRVASMLQEAWFRYSAAICPWTDAEMERIQRIWTTNIKLASRVPLNVAKALFRFPREHAGVTGKQPVTICIQTLAAHISQLMRWPDDIAEMAKHRWKVLCLELGSDNPEELGEILCKEARIRRCPIARLLRLSKIFGIAIKLPVTLTGESFLTKTWATLRQTILQDREVKGGSFSSEEMKFLDRWTTKTHIFRTNGFNDVDKLVYIKGKPQVPCGFLKLNDRDTLANIFNSLSPDPSKLTAPEPTAVQVWATSVPEAPEGTLGYRIVDRAVQTVISAIDNDLISDEQIRSMVNDLVDQILSRIIMKKSVEYQSEREYKSMLRRAILPRATIRRLLETYKKLHEKQLEFGTDGGRKRQEYIDHIYVKTLCRVKQWAPFKILRTRIGAMGTREYEIQWRYKLPPSYMVNEWFDGRQEDAIWVTDTFNWGDRLETERALARFQISQTQVLSLPASGQQDQQLGASAGTLVTKKIRPKLDPGIPIHLSTMRHANMQRDDWPHISFDGFNGIATIHDDSVSPPSLILQANQARLGRIFDMWNASVDVLKTWQARVSNLEAKNWVLSHQLLYQLHIVFEADCLIGVHPLVALAEFPSMWEDMTMTTGWGATGSHMCAIIVITDIGILEWDRVRTWMLQNKNERWIVLSPLLARAKTKWLQRKTKLLHFFPAGSHILQEKNSWRKAHCRTRKSKVQWMLWGNNNVQWKQSLGVSLRNLILTKDGFLVDRPPSQEDKDFGPAAEYYRNGAHVIASDGSVKRLNGEDVMGAAAVSWNGQCVSSKAAVSGFPPSSTKAELAGLQLATTIAPTDCEVIFLTDSLSSLNILARRQRDDFQRFEDRPTLISQVDKLVQAMNDLVNQGALLTVAKVKAHVGEPLNELADRFADAATNLECSEEESENTADCLFKSSSGKWTPWSSNVSAWLVQEVAKYQMWGDTNPRTPEEWREGRVLNRTTEWMLWTRAHRPILAQALANIHPGVKQKLVFQAISNVFPTQVNLHRWNPDKHTSTKCMLCGASAETFAHIQCTCPALQLQRIAAHNRIWEGVLLDIQKYYPHNDFILTREETVAGVMEAIQRSERTDADATDILDGLTTIRMERTHPETELRDPTDMKHILECSVLPSGRTRTAGRTRTLRQDSSERRLRGDAEPFFPSLTNSAVSPIIYDRAEYDAPASLPGTSQSTPTTPRMTCPDTLRRRPDGWLIDWRRKKIVILEFTRPYDYNRKDLAVANVKKLLKYVALQTLVEQHLPDDWTASIVAFSVGVKGTADQPAWRAGLAELGIDDRRHDVIVRHAIDEALASLCEIASGRYALIQKKQGNPGA